MTRYIVYLLTLTWLAITACTPSARAAQNPPPQTTVPATVVASTAPLANVPVQTQPPPAATANATPHQVAKPTVAPTAAPNPLNIHLKTDDKINASAVISTTGGTLSVQSADGTQFTITFPKGALVEDTKITLIPVTSVDGLPFSGGFVGGVQMAPEGLRLLQPATLTIDSSKMVTAKGFKTVAFAYHEKGEGLYLNPSDAKGNVLTLEVWHFSGAGAAQATAAEIETQQQQHVPDNPEDALIQRVTEYVTREHDAQQSNKEGDPDWWPKMAAYFREYYDRFVAPQLPVALQDCKAAPAVVSKALTWLRQVYLLGGEKEFESEGALINETVYQGTITCYNKEYEQCLLDHDLKHRTAMLGHLRLAALQGFDNQLDASKINKCKPRFRADTLMGLYSYVPVKGVICGLDKPFILKADGSNPSGGQYLGELTFTPTSETTGSWEHTATSCVGGGKCGKVTGNSTYQVQVLEDNRGIIMMNATTASSQIEGYAESWPWPAWQIELKPEPGSCSAE